MKTISAVVIMGFLLFIQSLKAQAQQTNIQSKTIKPYSLTVTCYKTTSVIFPHAITGVDRGSKDVLIQKAKGAENILQIKAARESFPETNITVVTADGKLNSFLVNYAKEPPIINLQISKNPDAGTVLLSPGKMNEAEIQSYAKRALKADKNVHGLHDNHFGIRFRLDGVFIHESAIYLRIGIKNQSGISYDIGQLRLFVRDKQQAKRTAVQEIEIMPLYTQNSTNKIPGNSESISVIAIPKLILADKKHLVIQLMEQGDGRHMELHVRNNHLLKAAGLAGN